MSASPAAAHELPAAAAMPSGRRFDHVRALFVQTPASLIGYLIGWSLMVAMYWPLAPRGPMLAWSGVLALLLLLRLAHYLRFRRNPDADEATLYEWRRSWKLLVLLQASCWAVAVWLFWALGTPYHRVALMLVIFSLGLASVQLLATQQRLYIAFVCLLMLPAIVRIATDTTQPWHWQLAGILVLQFIALLVMGRVQRSALDQVIRLKAHSEKLAVQLRTEMGVSEQARRAAEAASRAKTQFFAAASHDLRQPLHAMGLFAEALRQRTHDPEVASLVNSINESVDALEGLFGELLDITRIDTGGVDVNPAPVPMRELFARLRLHFEPTAFEKGLALSFHGARHVAFADPVILERILRNLVSNAIRYTDDGGVLVSCRQRGDKLLMQVWDSGIGISEATLPRIFDEFYQVQSQRPLEAHQRKGLGLGPGHRGAAGRAAGSADQCAIACRPRHGVLLRGAAGQGGACAGSCRSHAARAAGPDAARPADAAGGGRAGGARRPGGAAQGLGRERAGFRFGGLAAGLAGRRPERGARPVAGGLPVAAGPDRPGCAGRRAPPLAGTQAARHRHHRQHHRRPRERGRRARLPPADQAGAAEQAARDDRLQAGRARLSIYQRPAGASGRCSGGGSLDTTH
jgi:signal transduction histidine kinase